jgi:uncharacterized protein YpmB
MATKLNPGKFDVYESLLPDEPYAVIAGRDQAGPRAILVWADTCEKMIELGIKPESDREKIAEMRQLAKEMSRWRYENYGRWKQTPLFPETEEATRQP